MFSHSLLMDKLASNVQDQLSGLGYKSKHLYTSHVRKTVSLQFRDILKSLLDITKNHVYFR